MNVVLGALLSKKYVLQVFSCYSEASCNSSKCWAMKEYATCMCQTLLFQSVIQIRVQYEYPLYQRQFFFLCFCEESHYQGNTYVNDSTNTGLSRQLLKHTRFASLLP